MGWLPTALEFVSSAATGIFCSTGGEEATVVKESEVGAPELTKKARKNLRAKMRQTLRSARWDAMEYES